MSSLAGFSFAHVQLACVCVRAGYMYYLHAHGQASFLSHCHVSRLRRTFTVCTVMPTCICNWYRPSVTLRHTCVASMFCILINIHYKIQELLGMFDQPAHCDR